MQVERENAGFPIQGELDAKRLFVISPILISKLPLSISQNKTLHMDMSRVTSEPLLDKNVSTDNMGFFSLQKRKVSPM